jgi:hypothetical protein
MSAEKIPPRRVIGRQWAGAKITLDRPARAAHVVRPIFSLTLATKSKPLGREVASASPGQSTDMSKKKFSFGEITERAREQMRDDDGAVKSAITKWPELENLIPALTNDEYAQLSANIRAEGCRDPLVLWQQAGEIVLVDGHNRFRICDEHREELITKFGYDYKYIFRDFADVEAAKDWMINNQLGKRNLTEEWKSYLRGIQYRAEKQQQGRPKKDAEGKTSGDGLKTAERLAELHRVSDKTIRRDEKFVEVLEKITGSNDQLRKDILNRTVRLPKMELLSLENEDERILRRVGELVVEGQPFMRALGTARSAFRIVAPELEITPDEQTEALKAEVLKTIEKAVEKRDPKLVAKAKEMLDEMARLWD